MTEKRKKALTIYALVILIFLVAIMFIIPDSFFLYFYNKKNEDKMPEKQEIVFTDYEEQKKHLLNNQYSYEYLILDSMGKKSYEYDCTGKIEKEVESGTCTMPTKFSYTEKDKNELFKIDIKYLNVENIFDLIKDIEPEETKYKYSREYKYDTKINNLDTEIIIYASNEEITKIELSNAYMTYILKYSDITY